MFTLKHIVGCLAAIGLVLFLLRLVSSTEPAVKIDLIEQISSQGVGQFLLEVVNDSNSQVECRFQADCTCTKFSQESVLLSRGSRTQVGVTITPGERGEVHDGVRHLSMPIMCTVSSGRKTLNKKLVATLRLVELIRVNRHDCIAVAEPFANIKQRLPIKLADDCILSVKERPKTALGLSIVQMKDEMFLEIDWKPTEAVSVRKDSCTLEAVDRRGQVQCLTVPLAVIGAVECDCGSTIRSFGQNAQEFTFFPSTRSGYSSLSVLEATCPNVDTVVSVDATDPKVIVSSKSGARRREQGVCQVVVKLVANWPDLQRVEFEKTLTLICVP